MRANQRLEREYRSENILSNVLGEEISQPKPVPGEDAQFTKSDSRKTFSLFLEHSVFIIIFRQLPELWGIIYLKVG